MTPAAALLLAFTHVTVIDATGGPPLPNCTVVIAGDRIQSIGKRPPPHGAKVVDATGKFLIPGLWDMHVHFRGGEELIPDNESWLALFVSRGITGVREMGGDIAPAVFRWRTEIASGSRLGPRIVTSGPKDDEPVPAWPGSLAVTSPESARNAIRQLKAMGADFVKIYATVFPRPVFDALMDEAKQQKLSVVGHLPLATHTIRDSIEAGVRSIEHIDNFVLPGCSRSDEQLRDGIPYLDQLYRAAETFDPEWARDLIARMVSRGVWVTPTLAAATDVQTVSRGDYEHYPLRRYITPGIWRTWDPKISGDRQPFSDSEQKQWDRIRQQSVVLLKMLQDGGVGLLAGSDCGASNSFVFHGWGLHRELALMVEAGLTPMQALETATRNPARYLGELDRSGTVEPGKIADLVLLTANPLADIRNTEKIEAVVLRSKLVH